MCAASSNPGDMLSFHGVQVVRGSNPLAPTNEYKALAASALRAFLFGADFAPTFAPTRRTALTGT
jgi:hypothetical protein